MQIYQPAKRTPPAILVVSLIEVIITNAPGSVNYSAETGKVGIPYFFAGLLLSKSELIK